MFSFEKEYDLDVVWEWFISVPDTTTTYSVKDRLVGKYTIISLKIYIYKIYLLKG
jgi:hypothetical protein